MAAQRETVDDGLIVYYFHGNARCPTCQSIESQAEHTVHADFAAQLESGQIVWKVLNYEQPAVGDLAKKFDIQMPVVVLAKMRGGRLQDWKRLDEVWALVGDKPGFAAYVRGEIRRVLAAGKEAPGAAPLPQAGPPSAATASPPPPAPAPADLPLPKSNADLPLPK